MAKKRAEARKRLQAAKAEMKKANNQADQKTFDAGPFFKVCAETLFLTQHHSL